MKYRTLAVRSARSGTRVLEGISIHTTSRNVPACRVATVNNDVGPCNHCLCLGKTMYEGIARDGFEVVES